MSAEETELTFIRCPSCRSLVPAIATRCRMCGTQFDKKAEAKSEEEVPHVEVKKEAEVPEGTSAAVEISSTRSRVRQRTVSASSSEIKELKKQLTSRLEDEDNTREKPGLSSEKHSQYQELLSDDLDDDLPEIEEELPAYDESENKTSAEVEPYEFSKNVATDNFSEMKQEVVEPDKYVENDKINEHVSHQKFDSDLSEQVEHDVKSFEVQNKVRNFEEENIEKKVIMEQHPVELDNPMSKKVKTETSNSQQLHIDEGMLFGWLVSFINDSRGVAIEVRSGKFFLGRQKLRASDVVIQDTSVSTPHCMITADPATGLQIQDLMSERGTFVKKAGSNSYTQVINIMNVSHGDWIKLGDYEVMVSLMPTVKQF